MDNGSTVTIVITLLLCVGGGGLFCLIMFWVYGFTPLFHWFIKSNSEPARAVILEVKTAGWGWYAGSRYSQSLVFRPIRVKLEVHPNSGSAYVAEDRFNARAKFLEHLKPGAQMQVAVARANPQWVASLPETAVEAKEPGTSRQIRQGQTANIPPAGPARSPKEQLEQLKQMLDAGLITKEDYDEKKAEVLEEL